MVLIWCVEKYYYYFYYADIEPVHFDIIFNHTIFGKVAKKCLRLICC